MCDGDGDDDGGDGGGGGDDGNRNIPPRHATPVRRGGTFIVPKSPKMAASATPYSTGGTRYCLP